MKQETKPTKKTDSPRGSSRSQPQRRPAGRCRGPPRAEVLTPLEGFADSSLFRVSEWSSPYEGFFGLCTGGCGNWNPLAGLWLSVS